MVEVVHPRRLRPGGPGVDWPNGRSAGRVGGPTAAPRTRVPIDPAVAFNADTDYLAAPTVTYAVLAIEAEQLGSAGVSSRRLGGADSVVDLPAVLLAAWHACGLSL